ncbi:DUF4426 domain-containing protein [Neptuniibacter pectenicola]|mgnify:FL=1|jgi:hypothetical protein|uniref:DUF4426 domain-containing protein n=1 Tax=Neptuniibacter pectenicola TaxID=1806669 RepID=A0ABU9TT72_9GAMM|tara:strand:- start:102 stop:551 length:450 start_codon:yes stop_codon:yes gene_type:complete
MNQLAKWAMATLLPLIVLISPPLLADQYVSHGNYEIHYNAFNSTFIQPDVAKNIGISRSKRRALINVSVLKVEGDKKVAVPAIVSGTAANLAEQQQTLTFKKIDEGSAIYYLAHFGFTNSQVFRLALDVQPDPNQPAFKVEFEQRFYED